MTGAGAKVAGPAGAPQRAETSAALLLAFLVLVFVPVSFAYNGVLSNARPSVKNDFTSYYVAGLAVREGRPEALYYPEPVGSLLAQASLQRPWADIAHRAGIDHPNYYLYPPLFSVLFAPLTLLPYKVAYVVWVGLGGLFAAGSLLLVVPTFGARWRTLHREPRLALAAAAAVLVAGLFYPVSRTLAVGQSSLLLLFLMTGVLVSLRRRTAAGDATAGLLLAMGIMLKLTPAILLPWLALRRRWRALGLCGAAFALLAAISLAAVGWQPHRTFLFEMLGQLSGGTAFYPNQSLSGMLARAAGENLRLADLTDPASGAALAARWLGVLFILATLLVCARQRPGGEPDAERDDRAFGMLLLASLAASPISWEHHYVLALIPAWVLVRDAANHRWMTPRRAALAGAGLALCGSYIGLRVIGGPGDGLQAQVLASAGLIGGVLVWWCLARAPANPLRRPKEPATAPAALLTLMCVFAAGNFGFKLWEYNSTYAFGDFTSYYVAAATLVEGRGDPLYYPETPDRILARAETPSPWTETASRFGVRDANYYLYPPFFAMAMTPLAFLSYGTAHDLWYIANLAALAGCIGLYVFERRRARDGGALTGPEIALAVLAVALSWPSLFTFGAGQANFIVLLLLLGALRALRSGAGGRAGLLAAAAAGVKMTPAILFAWFLWRRRMVELAAAMAAVVALVVAGALVAGWGSYEVYVQQMIPLLSRGCAHWVNESPAAFFTRLFDGADMFSWAMAEPSTLARGAASAAGLGLIIATFWAAGRPGRAASGGLARVDLEFSLFVVATLFVSPLSWTHHSVLSLMGFLLAARWMVARDAATPVRTLLFVLAYTLVNVHIKPPGLFENGPLIILASYNLAGNLLLWGLLARLLLDERARLEAAGARA